MMDAIVLLPILAGIGLLYWSDQIKEENDLLKNLFRLIFLIMILLSLNLAVIDAKLNYAADSELVSSLADMVWYTGWIIFIVGCYYFFKILGSIYAWYGFKKQEKENEKYG
jgi:hypothetical protein